MRPTVVMLAALLGAGALAMLARPVAARPQYFSEFETRYPASFVGTEFGCLTCHKVVAGGTRNPYGVAFAASGYDFDAIENLDSDGDRSANIFEIAGNGHPGRPTTGSLASFLAGGDALPDADTNDDGFIDAADVLYGVDGD